MNYIYMNDKTIFRTNSLIFFYNGWSNVRAVQV